MSDQAERDCMCDLGRGTHYENCLARVRDMNVRIRELECALTQAREEGRRAGLEEAARAAEDWAKNYPTDVFPPTGTGTDSISARMARHTSGQIAREIRALATKDGGGT